MADPRNSNCEPIAVGTGSAMPFGPTHGEFLLLVLDTPRTLGIWPLPLGPPVPKVCVAVTSAPPPARPHLDPPGGVGETQSVDTTGREPRLEHLGTVAESLLLLLNSQRAFRCRIKQNYLELGEENACVCERNESSKFHK